MQGNSKLIALTAIGIPLLYFLGKKIKPLIEPYRYSVAQTNRFGGELVGKLFARFYLFFFCIFLNLTHTHTFAQIFFVCLFFFLCVLFFCSHNVKYVFTLVGGHISPILVAAKNEGVKVIDVRHEATAVFAADAVSRLTGTVGMYNDFFLCVFFVFLFFTHFRNINPLIYAFLRIEKQHCIFLFFLQKKKEHAHTKQKTKEFKKKHTHTKVLQ